MAAAAIAGGAGTDVKGYRDHRGVKVIGAWRWLPDYEFGIATEINDREMSRFLEPLKTAFSLLACSWG